MYTMNGMNSINGMNGFAPIPAWGFLSGAQGFLPQGGAPMWGFQPAPIPFSYPMMNALPYQGTFAPTMGLNTNTAVWQSTPIPGQQPANFPGINTPTPVSIGGSTQGYFGTAQFQGHHPAHAFPYPMPVPAHPGAFAPSPYASGQGIGSGIGYGIGYGTGWTPGFPAYSQAFGPITMNPWGSYASTPMQPPFAMPQMFASTSPYPTGMNPFATPWGNALLPFAMQNVFMPGNGTFTPGFGNSTTPFFGIPTAGPIAQWPFPTSAAMPLAPFTPMGNVNPYMPTNPMTPITPITPMGTPISMPMNAGPVGTPINGIEQVEATPKRSLNRAGV